MPVDLSDIEVILEQRYPSLRSWLEEFFSSRENCLVTVDVLLNTLSVHAINEREVFRRLHSMHGELLKYREWRQQEQSQQEKDIRPELVVGDLKNFSQSDFTEAWVVAMVANACKGDPEYASRFEGQQAPSDSVDFLFESFQGDNPQKIYKEWWPLVSSRSQRLLQCIFYTKIHFRHLLYGELPLLAHHGLRELMTSLARDMDFKKATICLLCAFWSIDLYGFCVDERTDDSHGHTALNEQGALNDLSNHLLFAIEHPERDVVLEQYYMRDIAQWVDQPASVVANLLLKMSRKEYRCLLAATWRNLIVWPLAEEHATFLGRLHNLLLARGESKKDEEEIKQFADGVIKALCHDERALVIETAELELDIYREHTPFQVTFLPKLCWVLRDRYDVAPKQLGEVFLRIYQRVLLLIPAFKKNYPNESAVALFALAEDQSFMQACIQAVDDPKMLFPCVKVQVEGVFVNIKNDPQRSEEKARSSLSPCAYWVTAGLAVSLGFFATSCFLLPLFDTDDDEIAVLGSS